MTLFLFVVMMLDIDVASNRSIYKRYLILIFCVVLLMTGLLLIAMNSLTIRSGYGLLQLVTSMPSPVDKFMHGSIKDIPGVNNTEALGLILFTDYLYAFELAAVILLVSIIATITLVHRKPRAAKYQNIVQQIMTHRNDRITLVKMTQKTTEKIL